MPEANPAPAPHIGLIHAFGICVECICNLERNVLSGGGEGIVLKLLEVVGSVDGVAYWGGDKPGGEGVFRS